MKSGILEHILRSGKKGKKLFAVLIDPDKFREESVKKATRDGADLFLVGGSLITNGNFEYCVQRMKEITLLPVLIFPGNAMQLDKNADAILFLSLISGRNPDLLIGQHVLAAPALKRSKLEVIPTAYLLIEGGRISSTAYMSNTIPIPAGKSDIAVATALAGELLGFKMIYLEAGSGAKEPVTEKMISEVRKAVDLPIIVGGGIRDVKQTKAVCKAGADVVVVGTAAEKKNGMIRAIAKAIHSF